MQLTEVHSAIWTKLEEKYKKIINPPMTGTLDQVIFYFFLCHNSIPAARKITKALSDSEEFGTWLEVRAAGPRELADFLKKNGISNSTSRARYLIVLLDQVWEFFDDCSLDPPPNASSFELEEFHQKKIAFLNAVRWDGWSLPYLKGLWGLTQRIPLDPHVDRILLRLGLAEENSSTRAKKEALQELRGKREPSESYRLLLALGQTTCLQSEPRCQKCPLKELCKTGRDL